MSKVKFQEIDRNIRREFGIYRMAGVTIGDKLDKRADVDEKFGFSDRQVTKYKLNFAVQDNRVTMYTFDLSNEELDKVDKTLDYYCKKYTGMEYNSSVINYKLNSYAVDIVFTNYQDNQMNYTISGGIIVLLVFLFGLSVVSSKKASLIFKILNVFLIIAFIIFNSYNLM